MREAQSIQESGLAELHMLHGDLPAQKQDLAVASSENRKVIFSTNIAETSLTLPNVTAVVDSGLARSVTHSPFTGLPNLVTHPVSQASAVQRTGRAGRTQAGVCHRLYTEHDFRHRPEFEAPEIKRADLSELTLLLSSLSIDVRTFDFFEEPPETAVGAALELLSALGAVHDGRPTGVGKALLRIPAHPRIGRVLLEAARLGVADLGALASAILSERELRVSARMGGGSSGDVRSGMSDVLDRIEAFEEVERAGFRNGAIRAANLEPRTVQAVRKGRDQYQRVVGNPAPEDTSGSEETRLLRAVLAGFSDRVGRRRRPNASQVVFLQRVRRASPEQRGS